MLAHFDEHRLEVLLGDRCVVGELKLLFVPTVRTFQILLPNVELKVRATAFTRKDSSFALADLLAWFFFGH
jgi:hypothetical protein